MSKILVLAEKPSVGRDIGRVLKCTPKGNGYMEGSKYIVTWALGHLVTLASPENHEKKYEKWVIEDLPIIPNKIKLEVIKKTRPQFETVKKLMLSERVSEIIIATDAGREGELVARWIIEKVGVKKRIKRLWISSVTDKAILDGFNNLKDGNQYLNLYKSAVARSEADWIVGLNATRALTCKYNAQLSCGRVQTPTIGMINQRENEIIEFTPKDYYGIKIEADGINLKWQDKQTNDIKSFNKEKIEKIIDNTKGNKLIVQEVKETIKRTLPNGLYDLTELQRDANRIFDYSAKETLSIMQKLYEQHKVLTYPRTDSKHLTEDIVGTLKDRLRACNIGEYSNYVGKILRVPIKGNKSFVDNSKVSDHHAIIPTEQTVILNDLSYKERTIYDLVVKRFFAVLYPPHEYKQLTIKAAINGEIFTAKGKKIVSNGWKEIYKDNHHDNEESFDNISVELRIKDEIKTRSIKMTTGKTTPPARFNEGTLLGAMENPRKFMNSKDKDLLETLGNTGGLGTVATRADIIEKLFNSFLLEKKGKDILITSKGKQLLELAPIELKSPELTGKWEMTLADIASGKGNKNEFIDEIKKYTTKIVKDIKLSSNSFKHDNVTRTKCPECGKFLLEVSNKNGKIYVCQDRECGYRQNISKVTNARCPKCHKKLNMIGEGDGKTFVCQCGHKEKLSAFNKRKGEKGNQLSKQDLSKYLEKQNKSDEGFNNPFAEALKNMKKSK